MSLCHQMGPAGSSDLFLKQLFHQNGTSFSIQVSKLFLPMGSNKNEIFKKFSTFHLRISKCFTYIWVFAVRAPKRQNANIHFTFYSKVKQEDKMIVSRSHRRYLNKPKLVFLPSQNLLYMCT